MREHFCLVCGHKAFQHEIGMNTPQTGRCLFSGCDCISCDTPSRGDLGDEVERLLAETVTLTTQLNEMREALRELCEAAEQAAKDSAGIFAMAHFRGEGYTGRTYEQEIAKAKALLDKSGEN